MDGRSDIVVSSQAETLNKKEMKKDPDALEKRPRGFFSDQVSLVMPGGKECGEMDWKVCFSASEVILERSV